MSDWVPLIPYPLVLFDGVCNLCNGVVNFLMDHDQKKGLRFGSLQSAAAREILNDIDVSIELADLETIVFIEPEGRGRANPRVSVRSDAVLRIAASLPRPWRWVRLLRFVPRSIRDAAYNEIARGRYRWFGKRDACRVPTAEEAERFIG